MGLEALEPLWRVAGLPTPKSLNPKSVSGFRVPGFGVSVEISVLFMFRLWRFWGLSWVWGLGFWVWGLGFTV